MSHTHTHTHAVQRFKRLCFNYKSRIFLPRVFFFFLILTRDIKSVENFYFSPNNNKFIYIFLRTYTETCVCLNRIYDVLISESYGRHIIFFFLYHKRIIISYRRVISYIRDVLFFIIK